MRKEEAVIDDISAELSDRSARRGSWKLGQKGQLRGEEQNKLRLSWFPVRDADLGTEYE